MIVHMFPKSQFTEEFIYFINNHFDRNEHLFVLYTNVRFELPKEIYNIENVVDYDKKSLVWLYGQLTKAKKIFFHNLSVNFDVLFMLYLNIHFIRKAIWLIWGSDLYWHRIPKKNYLDKFVEKMRTKIIRSFLAIASLTDGDYYLAQEWYGTNAKNIRLDYCEEYIISLLHDMKAKMRTNHDEQISILIGNSATETNQHKQILKLLTKYKDENIKLIVPLSYGDMQYADEIQKLGYELYGDKFVPIRKYLAKREYYELLNSIDIAIFNNNRQQATGNITALLYLGKKIYLRNDTSMWEEWVRKVGYSIHNINDISEEKYEVFIKNNKDEITNNFILVNDFFCVENRIMEWNEAFYKI